MFKRIITLFVIFSFILSYYQPIYAQPAPPQAGDFNVNELPVPGKMVAVSAPFAPLALKGLVVNLKNPLEFQFIVDTGRGPQDTPFIKEEASHLVKYFLAGLTIPEGDLWVNLSPYEKNRMIPGALGQTELGRDLLAQDYILKQLTASLIYPEKDLGKEFWSRVYKKAQEQFGTTNIPVNTFNKVWILPDQAQVFENGPAAYVTKATLKVMLDEDYTALSRHSERSEESKGVLRSFVNAQDDKSHTIASQIIRSIILPEITKEVNTGKNFAPLRQIYQALILAKWYKETIQNSLLDAVYTNKMKVAGVNIHDPAVKEKIYNRYLQAYKKGVFNYIKEEFPPLDGEGKGGVAVPRKYFSGGTNLKMTLNPDGAMSAISADGAMVVLDVNLQKLEAPIVGRIRRGEIDFVKGQLLSRNDVKTLGAAEYSGKYNFNIAQNPKRSLLVIQKTFKRGKVLEIVLFNTKNRQNLKGLGQYIGGRQFFMGYSGEAVENSAVTNIITKLRSYHRGDMDDGQFLETTGHIIQQQIIRRPIPAKRGNVISSKPRNSRVITHFSAAMVTLTQGQEHPFQYSGQPVRIRYQGKPFLVTKKDGVFVTFGLGENDKPITPEFILRKNEINLLRITVSGEIITVKNLDLPHVIVDIMTDEVIPEIIKSTFSNRLELGDKHAGIVKAVAKLLDSDMSIFEGIGPQSKKVVSILNTYKEMYGIHNVGALIEKTADDLLYFHNLGEGNLNYIRLVLRRHGLYLRGEWPIIRGDEVNAGIMNLGLKSLLDRDALFNHHLDTIGQVVDKTAEELSNLGITSKGLRGIRAFLAEHRLQLKGDAAMGAEKSFGGIDLNQISLNRSGKRINVQFDPAQLSGLLQGGFEGFAPVITGFQYIKSPFPLLGVNPAKVPEVLAKV